MKAEIADLEAELRNDPRHRKLRQLRDLLAAYEPPTATKQDVSPDPFVSQNGAGSAAPVVEVKAVHTKEERVRAELRMFCGKHGVVSRKNFLEHLIQRGIMGHENDPMANLANYMSHWKDEFKSDGAGNWSLLPSAPAH